MSYRSLDSLTDEADRQALADRSWLRCGHIVNEEGEVVSTVNEHRARLQNEYMPLRIKILNHYLAVAELTGQDVGARAHKLPPKLGYWHSTHSDLVHSVCPELDDVVDAIEALARQRDPNYIKATHRRQKPGPKPAWQRQGPLNTPGVLHQVGGEFRGGYK